MCKSEDKYPSVFLQWDFMEESVEDKERVGRTLNSFIGLLFSGIPAVLRGMDKFSEENKEKQANIIRSELEEGRYKEID